MCEIKQLEWQEPEALNNYCHVANTPFGDYYVHIDGGKHQAWFDGPSEEYDIGEPSGDLLKEQYKCQEHFESIVRTVLVPDKKRRLSRPGVLAAPYGTKHKVLKDFFYGSGIYAELGARDKLDPKWHHFSVINGAWGGLINENATLVFVRGQERDFKLDWTDNEPPCEGGYNTVIAAILENLK